MFAHDIAKHNESREQVGEDLERRMSVLPVCPSCRAEE